MRYIFLRTAAASRDVLVTVRGERARVVHFTFHILRRTAGGRRLGNVAEGPHSFRIKQRRRRRRRRSSRSRRRRRRRSIVVKKSIAERKCYPARQEISTVLLWTTRTVLQRDKEKSPAEGKLKLISRVINVITLYVINNIFRCENELKTFIYFFFFLFYCRYHH